VRAHSKATGLSFAFTKVLPMERVHTSSHLFEMPDISLLLCISMPNRGSCEQPKKMLCITPIRACIHSCQTSTEQPELMSTDTLWL